MTLIAITLKKIKPNPKSCKTWAAFFAWTSFTWLATRTVLLIWSKFPILGLLAISKFVHTPTLGIEEAIKVPTISRVPPSGITMIGALVLLEYCYCEASCSNLGHTPLASPLMNWISTREYLEVSNVFVRYKANGSVCLLSSELNVFMNVFVTFAIRSWLLLLTCYCHWLHSVINPRMRALLYILESKKVIWRVKVLLSWNMCNHDLWSKCACVQIYEFQLELGSEWGYKLFTANISPKILTNYWDLRIILADYWWWIWKI